MTDTLPPDDALLDQAAVEALLSGRGAAKMQSAERINCSLVASIHRNDPRIGKGVRNLYHWFFDCEKPLQGFLTPFRGRADRIINRSAKMTATFPRKTVGHSSPSRAV